MFRENCRNNIYLYDLHIKLIVGIYSNVILLLSLKLGLLLGFTNFWSIAQ